MRVFQEFNYVKGVYKEISSPFAIDRIYPLDEIVGSPENILAAYIPRVQSSI